MNIIFKTILLGLVATTAYAEDMTAEQILASGVTSVEKGLAIAQEGARRDEGFKDSEVTLRMTLRNMHGEESMRELRQKTFEVIDEKEGDKTMIIFDFPRDVKGTAFLTHSRILDPDKQWILLPALGKVKRISSKNKSGPFMGSEFAYEDIGSQEVGKYTYNFLRNEPCPESENLTCFVIERIPLYEHSGYTKQIVWVDHEHFRMLQADFYDRKKEHLKTLKQTEYQQYLNRYWRPSKMEMLNVQTGKSTNLTFEGYVFNTGMREAEFTKAKLIRAR